MQRNYGIDWLRAIIVLSIIPFHTLVIFNQDKNWIMFVKDTVNVPIFNGIDFILGSFNMVILFLLAGMAILYSLKQRSSKIFLKQRLIKLLIPFLTGSILLNPIMTYFWTLNQGKTESFIEHVRGFFTKNPGSLDGLNGGYTPGHLWFILYLFLFSIIGLPLYLYLTSEKSESIRNTLAEFFHKPMTILLLILPYGLLYAIPILEDKNPFAYLFVVCIGCLFATDNRYLKALSRDKWIYLSLSVLIFIMYFIRKPFLGDGISGYYVTGAIYIFARILPAFALIGIGNSYLNKKSKLLSYLSRAGYPIYVIHLLIVTAVGYLIIQLPIPPIGKVLLIISISYILCFFLYELLRRTRYIGILFGIPIKITTGGSAIIDFKRKHNVQVKDVEACTAVRESNDAKIDMQAAEIKDCIPTEEYKDALVEDVEFHNGSPDGENKDCETANENIDSVAVIEITDDVPDNEFSDGISFNETKLVIQGNEIKSSVQINETTNDSPVI